MSTQGEQATMSDQTSLRERHAAARPGCFFLDAAAPEALEAWLRSRGLLDEPIVELAPAGEGNMNLTLRVTTATRSFIVKQARPWVEKYPAIDAPDERVAVEAAFYEVAAGIPGVAERGPAVLFHEAGDRVLGLADLGRARDCTDAYGDWAIPGAEVDELGRYLRALHGAVVPASPILANRAMRALNHEHIFLLPLLANSGVDLDGACAGLAAASAGLRADRRYRSAVRTLGRRYLADGKHLVHGDFYLGSILRTDGGLRVIDPEFAFLGIPEFDLGVLLAHLTFAGWDIAEARARLLRAYGRCDRALVDGFAGAELMRRLLGVAQLPLLVGLGRRLEWLAISRRAVLEGLA